MNMNQIQAILTIDPENLPTDFAEILKKEQEMVAQWRAEGILEHLYLREKRNGAVLVFRDLTEQEVRSRMERLPFFAISTSIEYLNLMKQF